MRKIFLSTLSFLIIFSLYLYCTQPKQQSDRPVIYWKSDSNPQRLEQIKLFHKWLIKNGYVDHKGRPVVELRLDSANSQSKLIQAVSGVGGDIIDCPVGDFQSMGLLEDLTGYTEEFKFGLNNTYASLKPLLVFHGRQYAYPCNVNVIGLWGNVETFKKYGMSAPPEVWIPDVFEKIGREFTRRANKGKKFQDVFFCEPPNLYFVEIMHRSIGLGSYNETLTKCILNDKRYVELLKKLYKWTYEDKLFPTSAELASMSAESGYGTKSLPYLQAGKIAMISTGRWCLIRMRQSKNQFEKSLSRYPQEDFQNMIIGSRAAGIYKGSKHKKYAALFFAFLADKLYNDNIIKGADALPPNPKFVLNNPKYENPPGHPNEALTNNRELNWAKTIAINNACSPYNKAVGKNWKKYGIDKYFNGLATAEEVAKETQERINEEIAYNVAKNPELKVNYDTDIKLQKRIDAYKEEGKKIPSSWIKNPFYLRYYRSKGMIKEDNLNVRK